MGCHNHNIIPRALLIIKLGHIWSDEAESRLVQCWIEVFPVGCTKLFIV